MQLETRRLLLRPFLPGDLADLFAYASQSGVFERGGTPPCRTPAEARQLLARWAADDNRLALVLRESGRVVGHVSIKPDSEEQRSDTRELGCALNRDCHRAGLMSEAIRGVLAELFAGEIRSVWMCCFQDNLPSRRLIESLGFSRIGEGVFASKVTGAAVPTYEYRLNREDYAQPADRCPAPEKR